MTVATLAPPRKPWPGEIKTANRGRDHRDYLTDLADIECEPIGRVPGVTTFLKALGKGEGLMNWAVGLERFASIEGACDSFEALAAHALATEDAGYLARVPRASIAAMIETSIGPKKASEKEKEKAADIGGMAHKKIHWWLESLLGDAGPEPKIPDESELAVMAFQDWWKGSGLYPVRMEQTVWDAGLRVAGTVDLLAGGPDGYELIDYKSSKRIYLEHHLQARTYRACVENWVPVARARIVRIPKTLDDIRIEVREVGDVERWSDADRKFERRMYDDAELMEMVRCVRTLYRLMSE